MEYGGIYMKKLFDTVKNGATTMSGLLAFLIPNAGRDAVLTLIVWGAYWVIRFLRELLNAQWTLQPLLRNLAVRLSWGLALDILWAQINTNPQKTTPWWLNWVPVAWQFHPIPGWRVLLVILTGWAFYDALKTRNFSSAKKGISDLWKSLKP